MIVSKVGLNQLGAKFRGLERADFAPLMRTWEMRLSEGNREGVLAGINGRGGNMKPVTYRPRTARPKIGAVTHLSRFTAVGPAVSGINNNLTSAQYRTMAGPPLAPRGPFSRVITHAHTASGYRHAAIGGMDITGPEWFACLVWIDVMTVKGQPLLPFHFLGMGNNPIRDLRGVRRNTMRLAKQDAIDYCKYLIRGWQRV